MDLKAYKQFGECPVLHLKAIFKTYPESIYAGYALVKKGPHGSLQDASCITPKQRDINWYVPIAASSPKKEERRDKVRKSYEDFINQTRTFLNVHPNFSQQDLLRKELAIALFFLDRPDEAWKEVDKLSKLNGRWAEEAKAVLERKENRESPESVHSS